MELFFEDTREQTDGESHTLLYYIKDANLNILPNDHQKLFVNRTLYHCTGRTHQFMKTISLPVKINVRIDMKTISLPVKKNVRIDMKKISLPVKKNVRIDMKTTSLPVKNVNFTKLYNIPMSLLSTQRNKRSNIC